mmetsp:Transcript_69448/g.203214  ORF Transcript_69448/g.203214 Transcript_69448/m.203214 type:complete len:255 (+) Transcript_69448:71-835(+)
MVRRWKTAVLLISWSSAQEPLPMEKLTGLHGKMDANADGKVSMSEALDFSADMGKLSAKKRLRSDLGLLDGDRDGKVSLQEFLRSWDRMDPLDEEYAKDMAKRRLHEVERFKVADEDGDGALDELELQGLLHPGHHDGVLDLATRQAIASKDKDGDGLLSMREFWGGRGELPEPMMVDFRKLDKDGSGSLDFEELRHWESGRFREHEVMRKLFDDADKDGDEHVTAEELAAVREEIVGREAHYSLHDWSERSEL